MHLVCLAVGGAESGEKELDWSAWQKEGIVDLVPWYGIARVGSESGESGEAGKNG